MWQDLESLSSFSSSLFLAEDGDVCIYFASNSSKPLPLFPLVSLLRTLLWSHVLVPIQLKLLPSLKKNNEVMLAALSMQR